MRLLINFNPDVIVNAIMAATMNVSDVLEAWSDVESGEESDFSSEECDSDPEGSGSDSETETWREVTGAYT